MDQKPQSQKSHPFVFNGQTFHFLYSLCPASSGMPALNLDDVVGIDGAVHSIPDDVIENEATNLARSLGATYGERPVSKNN